MQFALSIVIIAQNAEIHIAQTLQALRGLSDDIIVLENGSTDNTAKIASENGARVVDCEWLGYGDTKNIGHIEAKQDWILSLDADEVMDATLYTSIKNINYAKNNQVYAVNRYMMWNNTMLHFGGSKESKIRLFHKQFAKWDSSEVHEQLLFESNDAKKIVLKGKLMHYSYENMQDAKKRNQKYAKADAIKKYNAGKKYLFWFPKVRGWIEFCKIYWMQCGFLDGKNGLQYAKIKQYYKILKYEELKKMYN